MSWISMLMPEFSEDLQGACGPGRSRGGRVGDVCVGALGYLLGLLDEAVGDDEAGEALLAAVLPDHGSAAEGDREAEYDAERVDDPIHRGHVLVQRTCAKVRVSSMPFAIASLPAVSRWRCRPG